jgi:hypothetical protein
MRFPSILPMATTTPARMLIVNKEAEYTTHKDSAQQFRKVIGEINSYRNTKDSHHWKDWCESL